MFPPPVRARRKPWPTRHFLSIDRRCRKPFARDPLRFAQSLRFTAVSHRVTQQAVASRAEAWVETGAALEKLAAGMSPPARRRGSKPDPCRQAIPHQPVASRAEAWVETALMRAFDYVVACRLPRGGVGRNLGANDRRSHRLRSPPARRRGSKRRRVCAALRARSSPPARRRGSKRDGACHRQRGGRVASRAEAWVETTMAAGATASRRSPPARRRGSKRAAPPAPGATAASPPARRRGSKHDAGIPGVVVPESPPARRRGSKRPRAQFVGGARRSPPARRRGSKLGQPDVQRRAALVASRAEAWVETSICRYWRNVNVVASRAEAWVETRPGRPWWRPRWSPPARRRGSKPR